LVYAIHDRVSWDDPRRRGLNLRPATPFFNGAARRMAIRLIELADWR